MTAAAASLPAGPAPAISVVLPVYNAERFVGAALDSIAAQSERDFEAIVIDDGSTDGSLAVMRRHVGGDARFRIVSRPNAGLVATCNEGIAAARGRYVFRMDADDVSHSERFARQLAYLETHPECVAVGTRMLVADETMLPIIAMIGSFTHEEIDAENLRGAGSAMCHPSVAMRRDAVLAVGGYRAEYECAEDLDLFLRLAEVGRLANLPEVLITYRQHLGSIGASRRRLQVERTAAAVAAARRRRSEVSMPAPADDEAPGPRGGGAASAPEANGPAAPASDYGSAAEIHRKWAWLALAGGHPRTARKHALRALCLQPLSGANPRLIACAIRGR
jgi:hypothetical protein